MARKMTFSGQKYYSKPVNNGNGDKDEPGKSPKPTYKKMEDPNQPKKPTMEQGKKVLKDISNIPDVHPVTGKRMTQAEKIKMAREKEYRKNTGYNR